MGKVEGEYIKEKKKDEKVVVIRGMKIKIDKKRKEGLDKGIEG